MEEGSFSTREAAKMVGIGSKGLRYYIDNELVKPRWENGARRWTKEEIEKVIKYRSNKKFGTHEALQEAKQKTRQEIEASPEVIVSGLGDLDMTPEEEEEEEQEEKISPYQRGYEDGVEYRRGFQDGKEGNPEKPSDE